jgi:general secretion pathway protein C
VNERNLFSAKREQISIAEEDLNEVEPGRWQDAQPTTLPLKLISTMVFLNPFDSRAVISQAGTGQARVYSIGECEEYQKKYDRRQIETILPQDKWEPERPCNNVSGIATVKRIEEFRVYIFNERDKKYEYLSLLPEGMTPMRQRAETNFEVIEGEGVRKTGPTSYEINQNEFDKALSNVARLMTEARAVPEMDAAGNPIGFKIIYLKEGSLFEKIGIERMDVLTRINGYELNSAEKGLQLFSQLKTASKFTIDLKRGDRSLTLDYYVVR